MSADYFAPEVKLHPGTGRAVAEFEIRNASSVKTNTLSVSKWENTFTKVKGPLDPILWFVIEAKPLFRLRAPDQEQIIPGANHIV